MDIRDLVGRGAPPLTASHLRKSSAHQLGAFLLAAAVLSACSDGVTAPVPSEAGTSVRWNTIARELVVLDRTAPPVAGRAYTYLSVAQYTAALAARGVRPDAVPSLASLRDAHSPSRAAIATASAHVLGAMFPSQGARIEHELAAELAALRGESIDIAAIERAEAIGGRIAASLLARAQDDGWNASWAGTVPNGDGFWFGTSPQLPMWGQVRPWLWDSGSELRGPPPPAFSSQQFRDALDEVRQIAETRTAAQMESARFWADGAGTYTPPGHWNEIAAQLIRERGLGDLQAARTLALMNVAMADAAIGCWDTKFTYWVLRPWQADSRITTPIGQPPHPSYPSGHACFSGAGAKVLAALFPSEAEDLERMAVEACDSRVYAGIHYRFDAEAGMTIGIRAAERALERGDQLLQSEIERAYAGALEE
jgi:hypothetical protein